MVRHHGDVRICSARIGHLERHKFQIVIPSSVNEDAFFISVRIGARDLLFSVLDSHKLHGPPETSPKTWTRFASVRTRSTKHHYAFFTKLREAEFMQYRWPVGRGPSLKTWPRCAPQRLHSTAVRRMPKLLSVMDSTFSSAMGW